MPGIRHLLPRIVLFSKGVNSLGAYDQVIMHDLTGFQRDLLYVIAGLDTPHGLAIKRELDQYYQTPINYGRLYPNLDVLGDKGLIAKAKADGRTNAYTVTRRGRSELAARLEWENDYLQHENRSPSTKAAPESSIPS